MERILQKRYRVLRSLGRGGLGAVYLCDDLRLPGRQWAIKQMNSPQPELFETFRASFEVEASTLSQLKHPNLPDLVDYFEEGHDLFLVMEYVEGENLAEHVRRLGPLGERETFEIGRTLLDILDYLHHRAPPIIFRDLKPENVMISSDGHVKLIDFGLARRFAPEKRADTMPSGSVGYAAPEQWEDQAQTDARSDVYAWGATLVFLLTGKIPSPVFPMAVLRDVPLVSEAARAILERCTRPRPADRYRDVRALAQDVRAHLDVSASSLARRMQPSPGIDETSRRDTADASAVSPPAPHAGAPAPPAGAAPSASRAPWRAGSADYRPLRIARALLVLATLVWLGALAVALPPRSAPQPVGAAAQPDPVATITRTGVEPYRQSLADADRRDKARQLYRQQRWAEAIAALDPLITETPQDAELQILAANCYLFMQKGPVIRLPFIGSGSGPDAFDSYAHLYGLALAQATINARGGIRGRRVVVDVYDDRSEVSTCLQVAQALVKDPKTLVVLGPTNSQRELAIAPIFNVAHVSLVAPTASSQSVWDAGPYIFTASDSRPPRVRALARHMSDQGVKTVGVIAQGSSRLSREMADAFEQTVRARGIHVIALPAFEENQSDFSAQVQAVNRTNPDLVFFSDYRPSTMALFARQLRASGSHVRLCAQTIAFSRDLVDVGGDAVEGLVLCEYFHPQLDTPAVRAFMAAFRRKFGELTPPYAVANTFDAFMAVAAALQQADTREGVREFLAASGVTRPAFDGISGRFAFGKRLDARPLWIIEVRGGRFGLIEAPSHPTPH